MYTLRVTTFIAASIDVCFDLSRNVEAHLQSTADTRERAVAGKTTGLLELGDEVVWQARHFGVTQQLASRITQFRPPWFFQDRMTRGAFRSLEHDHFFTPQDNGTLMVDVLTFSAPLGLLGWLAERLFLARHMKHFLRRRAAVLKTLAEESAGHTAESKPE